MPCRVILSNSNIGEMSLFLYLLFFILAASPAATKGINMKYMLSFPFWPAYI